MLADEQADQRKLTDAKALAGELRVQTFALSYAKAGDLSQLLTKSALSQRGQIQTDARTNTLIITDLPDRLQTAATLIGTLDKAEPQVEVEARVVQTTRDFARAIGIQWGLNGRVSPEIGNTTPLAFPNNGSLGGRVGDAQGPGTGFTQGPTDPRGTAPNQNTATVVSLAGRRRDVRHRPGARVDQRRVQPRRRAHRAREHRQGTRPVDAAADDAEQPGSRSRAGHSDSDSDRRQQHGHRAVQGRGAACSR